MTRNGRRLPKIWTALLATALLSGVIAYAMTPVVNEEAKLTASDAQNSDLFGFSVSLDGDTMVVGAREASAAYVFTLDAAGAWTEAAKLVASDPGVSDEFGRAVGVSEDTIVVGARANDSEGVNTGSAYVFTRDAAGAWTQAAKLVASDAGDFDFFGTAVAVSGDTVVVAAHFDDDANVNAGAAYVFTRDAAGNWPQTTKLVAPEAVVFALLGENAVAICGDTIVAGAPSDGPGGSRSGSAYVFTRDAAGVWAKTAKLTASDPSSPGFFGNGVGISGDTIVVGAWYNDSVAGAAYIFTRDATGAWTESAKLVASDSLAGDHFGWQVGISADTAVVGAYNGGLNSFGSAYVFTPDPSGVWTETAKLLASDPFLHDAFGISVAVSGGVAAIGAVAEETPPQVSTGSVYVFDVPNTNIPPNTPPTAVAGPGQSIHAGDLVTLDGSGSFDDTTASGDLGYAWTLTVKPAGSTATLSSATAIEPTFTADKTGTYIASLVVTDEGGLPSVADEVEISSENLPPAADAGIDLLGPVGVVVMVTGTATDPESDPLTYQWTIASAPAGSTAALTDSTTLMPSLIPDEIGDYVLSLVASDPNDDSPADTMTVTAISGSDFAELQLAAACDYVADLDDASFDAKGHRKSMCNDYAKIAKFIQKGQIALAISHLNAAIERVDGWTDRPTTAPDPKGAGQPHAADYLLVQMEQLHVYGLLNDALAAIQ